MYKMKRVGFKTRRIRRHVGGTKYTLSRAYPAKQETGRFNFLTSLSGGGGGKHREGCRCSGCKFVQTGAGPNHGLPYPDGLLGHAWTPSVKTWPGIDGISMGRNHLGYNTYSTDVSRQAITSPPIRGGTQKKKLKNKKKTSNKKTRTNIIKKKRGQKGGTLSNFLGQDFVNLGRQFQFNAESAWNTVRGNEQSPNPLPWKDQMTR